MKRRRGPGTSLKATMKRLSGPQLWCGAPVAEHHPTKASSYLPSIGLVIAALRDGIACNPGLSRVACDAPGFLAERSGVRMAKP